MKILKTIFTLLKDTFQAWNADRAPRLAAALSYYTIFSIAPFLIVVIAVTGLVAGQDAIRGRLDEQIQGLVGRQGADMIQELIQNSSKPSENILATVVGLATLVLGAGGVFGDTPRPLKRCGFLEATSAQSADGCDSRTRLKIVFRPSYFPDDRRNYA